MISSNLSDIENEFKQTECFNHSKPIVQICIHQNCSISLKSSLLCEECFETHQTIHNDLNEYITLENALPEKMEYIFNLLSQNISSNISTHYKRIDLIFENYADNILEKLNEIRDKLKSRISNDSKNKIINRNIHSLKVKFGKDLEETCKLSSSKQKMQKYFGSIKENMKVYLSISHMIQKNKQELDQVNKSISKIVDRYKINTDFVTIFGKLSKDLDIEMRNESFEVMRILLLII